MLSNGFKKFIDKKEVGKFFYRTILNLFKIETIVRSQSRNRVKKDNLSALRRLSFHFGEIDISSNKNWKLKKAYGGCLGSWR